MRCYVQEVAGGKPRAVTPEGTSRGFVSPDGRTILVQSSSRGLLRSAADGGEPQAVPGTTPEDWIIHWGADGRSVLVFHGPQLPVRAERLDLATGRRAPFRTLGGSEMTGAVRIGTFAMTDDEKSYAYSYGYQISHLFLVEGAR